MQTSGEPRREFSVAATIIKLPVRVSRIKKRLLSHFLSRSPSLSRKGKRRKLPEATKMQGIKRFFTISAFSHQLKNKSGWKHVHG